MNKLLKQIREHLNLSQSDFAEELKVTFQTVNRWGNGHVYPNRLAQSNIYEYCKNKNVPVYEMILDRIEKETRDINVTATPFCHKSDMLNCQCLI